MSHEKVTILESDEVESRNEREARELSERIYQWREWLSEQPYINAQFDSGVLAAAQELIEMFASTDDRMVWASERPLAQLAKAIEKSAK